MPAAREAATAASPPGCEVAGAAAPSPTTSMAAPPPPPAGCGAAGCGAAGLDARMISKSFSSQTCCSAQRTCLAWPSSASSPLSSSPPPLPPPSSPLDAPGVLSIVSAGAAGALKALKQNGAGLISDLSGCAPGAPGIDCSSRRLLATSLVIMAAGLAAATALYACICFLPRYRRRRESRAHKRLVEDDRKAALQAVESVDASPSRSRRQTASRGRGRGAALGSTESVAAPRARPASGPTVPPGSESADVEEEEWEEEVEERKGEKRPLSPVPLPPEEERESVPQESRIRRMANVLFVWVQRSPAGRRTPMLTYL
mmetsp:Transcript_15697/g.51148  ORF Transcript_15697/g.51148 Transcript_15697/m.51148 type:complete len:315 (+) Transcript_15697:847-1791(+)